MILLLNIYFLINYANDAKAENLMQTFATTESRTVVLIILLGTILSASTLLPWRWKDL